MRYKSAKNTTYILNEGVDMHQDVNPGAFNSSSCNTMYIILTTDFWDLQRFSPHTHIITCSTAKTQIFFAFGFGRVIKGQCHCKFRSLRALVPSCRQQWLACKSMSFHPSLLSGDIRAHWALPFPVTRPPVLFSNWLKARQSRVSDTRKASDPVNNITQLKVIGWKRKVNFLYPRKTSG